MCICYNIVFDKSNIFHSNYLKLKTPKRRCGGRYRLNFPVKHWPWSIVFLIALQTPLKPRTLLSMLVWLNVCKVQRSVTYETLAIICHPSHFLRIYTDGSGYILKHPIVSTLVPVFNVSCLCTFLLMLLYVLLMVKPGFDSIRKYNILQCSLELLVLGYFGV